MVKTLVKFELNLELLTFLIQEIVVKKPKFEHDPFPHTPVPPLIVELLSNSDV